ncbi:hypothetical protein [Flavobacterium caseinilyticum]|uniref:Tetratricopeptide repeat protein n=1 Tax=Flavobacterium caseinilyticum TaxID=2541732 RepID=A0A4R5ANR9_9FLAO|nr:hypothetical protein [Flavobacterium caseinilyticum]TDD74628.1 hypothetical protein E0F89_14065 [Flavobacterium caseinilyticum]
MSGRKKISFEDWEEEQENVPETINCIDQSVQNVSDTLHKEEHATTKKLDLLEQARCSEQEKKIKLAWILERLLAHKEVQQTANNLDVLLKQARCYEQERKFELAYIYFNKAFDVSKDTNHIKEANRVKSIQNTNKNHPNEVKSTTNKLDGILSQESCYEKEKKIELAYVSQKKTYENAVTGIKSNYGGDLKAIQDFKTLISQGFAVADCCYKLGHYYTYSLNNFSYTDAKMYLEKANLLTSNDSKILETLKFCETKNEAKILETLNFCEAKKEKEREKERADYIFGLTVIFILTITILFCYFYWGKFGWWSLTSIPIDIIILAYLSPSDDK